MSWKHGIQTSKRTDSLIGLIGFATLLALFAALQKQPAAEAAAPIARAESAAAVSSTAVTKPALSADGIAATGIARQRTELSFLATELEMSESDILAFVRAGEKVNIAPGSMMRKLQSFKDISDGLRFNINGVRNELIVSGGGWIVDRIQAAKTQTDKLKEALKSIHRLSKEPNGMFLAQSLAEMLGLGRNAVRLTVDQVQAELDMMEQPK